MVSKVCDKTVETSNKSDDGGVCATENNIYVIAQCIFILRFLFKRNCRELFVLQFVSVRCEMLITSGPYLILPVFLYSVLYCGEWCEINFVVLILPLLCLPGPEPLHVHSSDLHAAPFTHRAGPSPCHASLPSSGQQHSRLCPPPWPALHCRH